MKKLILLITAAVFAVSCSSDLEDLNKNIKDPVSVSGESLFVTAQKRLVDQMVTPNVNLNNNRLWVQHWQETTYPDESNYDQVTRSIPDNHWRIMYKDVLNNLREAAEIIGETDLDLTNPQKPNKLAITEILSVFAFSNLVETYGDIPYEEALDIDNLLPKYDDAETVYLNLVNRLDTAIASMNSESSFNSSEDMIYGGDVESWKKFANTLKLRMGLMLADVNGGLSKDIVESAYAGVFQSNADDASYAYSSSAPNNNPLNNNLVLSGRNDYVAGKTLVDIMNNLNDPRRANYFDPNQNQNIGTVASVSEAGGVATITFTGSLTVNPVMGNNVYVESGAPEVPTLLGTISAVGSNFVEIEHIASLPENGVVVFYAIYNGAVIGEQSRYADFTHVNRTIVEPTLPGTILSFIETKFLLAEAAARNYSVGGSAKEHYDDAIRASFEKWGSVGVADYLAKPEVDYNTAIANSNASTPWKQVIGTQAWIALYNRTFAPYLSVRRLDFPVLAEPVKKESGFPVRYTYPVTEQNLNGSNYNNAASSIGGDVPETRLFWDKEYTFGF